MGTETDDNGTWEYEIMPNGIKCRNLISPSAKFLAEVKQALTAEQEKAIYIQNLKTQLGI